MTEQDEIVQTIKVLRKEVEVLTTRLRPAGTGYLHTALDVINSRIDELIGSAIDGQPDQVRGLAGKIFDEDIYGNLEGQARLRKIQDATAGRDTVEHTEEYFDRNRNRPMEGENLPVTDPFTEGLSNRSMKQKYGQAVQTVSEMMQEELEPLPINTFE